MRGTNLGWAQAANAIRVVCLVEHPRRRRRDRQVEAGRGVIRLRDRPGVGMIAVIDHCPVVIIRIMIGRRGRSGNRMRVHDYAGTTGMQVRSRHQPTQRHGKGSGGREAARGGD